jgi:HEAT repeat protein
MKGNYRFSALIIAALIAIPAGYGQSQSSGSGMSVEESYLQEAVDLMIVRETSKQDSQEQKLIALAFIGDLVEQGNTSDELRIELERLSLEGTNVQAREKGRLKNDYPEVRRQAARLLGSFRSDEAKIALLRVCVNDNEPLVLQEAVRSLGNIGIDKDGEAIGTIVWVTNKFTNSTAPDNLLAIAAIDAIQKIARNSNGVREEAFNLLIKISEGPYSPPVREKAKQTIMDIRSLIANNAKAKRNQQGQPK